MAITRITNSSGTILNRYTLTYEDSTTESVRLTFNPSDDYVAGTQFAASPINAIITEIENAIANAMQYEVLQISDMDAGDTCECSYSNAITSVSSSDTSKATVTYSDKIATITAVASGSCTITIVENSTTHTIPVSVN